MKLTLYNCIMPESRLRNTPSAKDGCPHELEVDLRIVACEYMHTAGVLLRLPSVAVATAQVLFQRFFYSKSLVKYNMLVRESVLCTSNIPLFLQFFLYFSAYGNGLYLPCC